MAESATGGETGEGALEAFEALVRARRTVKPQAFDSSRRIPRELLERLLACACWAPTHGLTEPWRFFVFEGEARRRLGDFLHDLYPRVTPEAARRPEKRDKLLTQPLHAPVVVAPGVKVGSTVPATEEEQAVACAVQNLWLAAAAAGVGVAWSSPPVTTCAEFVQWLGLGPGDRCLGLLYLGWPQGEASGERRRRPLAERVVWKGEGDS